MYQILKNRLYIGEIEHRGNIYPGQHEGIIDQETWDKTASVLREHNRGRRRPGMPPTSSLLAGILVDVAGNRFTPTHLLLATWFGPLWRFNLAHPLGR